MSKEEKMCDWLNQHPKMKKCLENYDIEGIKIYGGKFNEERGNSFFYNGSVYVFEYNDRQLSLMACGEIRIYKNGELVFDVKERNSGFGFEVETDKQLSEVTDENGFIWENNNWFECEFKTKKDEYYDNILGDVYNDMEEAFSSMLLWIKDDEWWEK